MIISIQQQFAIDFERVLFYSPTMAGNAAATLVAGDVYLDCFPYSGPTSCIEAMQAALPIVTRTGATFRSDFVAGIFRQLHLEKFVTHDETEYIALAKRLAESEILRNEFVQVVKFGFTNERSFDARFAAKDFEQVLLKLYQGKVE